MPTTEKPAITPSSTPKQRYLAANKPSHRKLVDQDAFDAAADAVLLEYNRKLCEDTDSSNAAMVGLKMQGAHEFLKEFRTFAEDAPPRPQPQRTDNLRPVTERK